MTNKFLLNKKWLYNKYVIENKSISDIAKILFKKEIKLGTVYRWLVKHDIERRGFGGHINQRVAAHKRIGKYSAWNKGKIGIMPEPWNKGKGKRFMIDKFGYKWILVGKNHPMSGNGVYAAEHRIVMSEILGRPLSSKELVHHKNKNRQDNTKKNLMLIKIGEPNAHETVCPKCKFHWMTK